MLLCGAGWSYTARAQSFDVLVFYKTAGFKHSSIDEGIAAIKQLGLDNGFNVTETDDATRFSDAVLAQYRVVVFLSTTGDVLDNSQQAAFERYIAGGGGWVGIHAASDTEYTWPWYGGLVGAYFLNHPAIEEATLIVQDRTHPSTAHLGATWTRTDEWYTFRTNPRSSTSVLMTIDESTYAPNPKMGDHPIAWYHSYSGGRAWYTALGHTEASFAEPAFLQHILGGIRWAAERPAQASPAPTPAPSATPAPTPAPSASPAPQPPRRCFLPLMQ